MRVALDAGHALDRNPSGVAAYSRNLIAALSAVVEPQLELVLGYRLNRYFRALQAGRPAGSTRFLLEEATAPWLARRVELFHGLNQRLPRTRFRRTTATFHDLFVMSGDYSTAEFRQRFTGLARETAERADRVITVSQSTADQVVELLGYPHDQIRVIAHGVDVPEQVGPSELDRFRAAHDLERPFLLHVGAIQTRKNITRLVNAFETLDGNPLLVLAGGEGYGAREIRARIERSPARSRIRLMGYVDGSTRARLYRGATALAFPSLDEGFGMPVLEAMASGLPVLTSNRSALPEVAGEAALLVDPTQVEQIRDGLRRILEEPELRDRLQRSGLARAAEFSWRRAAEATLEVYRELLG